MQNNSAIINILFAYLKIQQFHAGNILSWEKLRIFCFSRFKSKRYTHTHTHTHVCNMYYRPGILHMINILDCGTTSNKKPSRLRLRCRERSSPGWAGRADWVIPVSFTLTASVRSAEERGHGNDCFPLTGSPPATRALSSKQSKKQSRWLPSPWSLCRTSMPLRTLLVNTRHSSKYAGKHKLANFHITR